MFDDEPRTEFSPNSLVILNELAKTSVAQMLLQKQHVCMYVCACGMGSPCIVFVYCLFIMFIVIMVIVIIVIVIMFMLL